MENASKALIIAGAILISILLISIGIIVINSISDPLNQSINEAEKQAIEMFNAQFTGFSGEQQASAIKTLMTKVTSSNGNDAEHKVTVSATLGGTSYTTPGTIQANVSSKKKYRVVIEDTGEITTPADQKTKPGYLNKITITEL